ncbi:Paxillin [Madurella mycetomatis]|uniref:Paxillin n=1 Tax=Madurella mycetomatis TaxID=100816 RepID=A0A175W879_9PEZI|nr:Paxillin [Madurella mycetomatis]
MFTQGKSKERTSNRKVTPPSPSYMTNEQFAAYLADLRKHRTNRPVGARPPPASKYDGLGVSVNGRPPATIASPSETSLGRQSIHQRAQSDVSSVPPSVIRPSISGSVASRYSAMNRGTDYYPDRPVQPLKPSEVVPSATYIERGQRWMEKEEAFSLRQAMEDMDIKDQTDKGKEDDPETSEDKRLYEAALNEAAELVWQHQNPGRVPQPGAPYRYRPHLRKNSYAHARTASAGMYGSDVAPTGLARGATSGSVSGSSSEGDGAGPVGTRTSFSSSRQAHGVSAWESLDSTRNGPAEPRSSKSYGGISSSPAPMYGGRRRSSLKRNISGEVEKPFSGDQIWEEPDGQASGQPLSTARDNACPLRPKPKNPLNRVQFAPNGPPATNASPSPESLVSKTEIHRNPPSQSRNPGYTTNERSTPSPDSVPRKHGMEIRSDEIRQATSMRLKDRSTKLPTPSAVSDSPGRPIVSFDRDWKPQREATDDKSEGSRFGRAGKHPPCLVPGGLRHQQPQQQTQTVPAISVTNDSTTSPSPSPSTSPSPTRGSQPPPPAIQVDGPSVPAIAVSDSDSSPSSGPTIVIEPEGAGDGPSIPVIVTPDSTSPTTGTSRRPLPTPQKGAPRIRQSERPRGHWSPAPRPVGSRATARCHECGDFIEGRFVSLAGSSERFHPQCFRCYSCGTSLEALEISPEPDAHRAARLERIARRARGEVLSEEPGETMAEDGDERLRFYCHLDWHELFAPRCKHCKTPIMGEHVVALGAHWHFGHFFCAECGDPFERGMTHIEKDGYAWCVSCQTKRTERRAPKCRKCRKAVVGQYIRALGGEWHDECFRCATCNGGFDDGQIFPMEGRGAPGETVVLCTKCMEMELKA